MYNINLWEEKLISEIGQKRFNHSKRVMEEALRINKKYKLDPDKVKCAGILHDCAKYNEERYLKEFKESIKPINLEYKEVLHSFLGAEVAKEVYNINDIEVLDAIRFHTTGRENMTTLDKIIFLADATEPKRSYPGVKELRRLTDLSLDEACAYCLDHNIEFLIKKHAPIHPLTVLARNYLIKEKND